MDKVNYEPVAGLEIPEAFTRAIKMAQIQNQVIVSDINDIVMHIKPTADLKTEVARFYELLKVKFAIQDARNEMKRKQR